jgi:P27 family predicted phage terminase small subunit
MSRKPIGDRPMTPAERNRRCRERAKARVLGSEPPPPPPAEHISQEAQHKPKAASDPKLPAVLDETAMCEWRRIEGALKERNALHEIDHASLAAYCQMYSRWVAAEKALARMAELDPKAGGLVITTSGGQELQNPLVGIASRAASAMVKYAAEFGMTPNSRRQVKAAKPMAAASVATAGKKELAQKAADQSRFSAMSTPKLIIDNAG